MDRRRGAAALMAIGTLTLIHACQIESVTPVVVRTVTVEPGEASVTEGNALQFTATVLDEFDESLSAAVVEWTSEDRNVLAIDPDGTARALSAGSTVVRATFEGVSGSSEVTVLPSLDCKKPPKDPKGKRKGRGGGHDDDGGGDDDDGDDGDGDDGDDDDGDDDDGDDDDGDDDDDGGHGNHHHNGGDDDDDNDDGNPGHDGDDDDDKDEDDPDDDDEDEGEPHCAAANGHHALLGPVVVLGDPR